MAARFPVLIVDDEPIVRDSIGDWLTDAGYKTLTASTGEEALQIIDSQDVSVMVLDIRLPGRTGMSVLKEVREQHSNIKTIIITAYPVSDLTAEALRLGAFDCLIKPIAPDDLERLVKDAVRQAGN